VAGIAGLELASRPRIAAPDPRRQFAREALVLPRHVEQPVAGFGAGCRTRRPIAGERARQAPSLSTA
jgi:hypothetical protein